MMTIKGSWSLRLRWWWWWRRRWWWWWSDDDDHLHRKVWASVWRPVICRANLKILIHFCNLPMLLSRSLSSCNGFAENQTWGSSWSWISGRFFSSDSRTSPPPPLHSPPWKRFALKNTSWNLQNIARMQSFTRIEQTFKRGLNKKVSQARKVKGVPSCLKNDRRNSGGSLRQKFNLIDI